MTTVVVLTALPLSGMYGSVIVAVSSTALLVTSDAPFVARLFNSANIAICGVGGAISYSCSGGYSHLGPSTSATALIEHVLGPMIIATAVQLALNIFFLSLMIALGAHQSLGVTVREALINGWSPYPIYPVIAFVFAVLWASANLGAISILPIVAPLLIAQWSVALQAEENDAHLRTVETLVAAAQASQPILHGRSAWVDVVSREIGLELRLSASLMHSLQYAALLHDIGLVAPAAHTPGERLTGKELRWIKAHPQQGVRMLQGIDFLSDAVVAVGHHHERWDGNGYPSGLEGEQIPLLARILAIADAYCALLAADPDVSAEQLTSVAERSLDALRPLAGLQFDAVGLEALAHAQPRIVESLSVLIARQPPQPITGVDPHLPWVSAMFASARADI
nr:HD domain-containing phosphohydrolase [Allobranchiibius huperziae]